MTTNKPVDETTQWSEALDEFARMFSDPAQAMLKSLGETFASAFMEVDTSARLMPKEVLDELTPGIIIKLTHKELLCLACLIASHVAMQDINGRDRAATKGFDA